MGISSTPTLENKRTYKTLIDRYNDFEPEQLVGALTGFFHPDADINVVQPINRVDGPAGFISRVMEPMLHSFEHLYRRTDMLFGGEYNGGEWVVSHGHYAGAFVNAWMGIPPADKIVWLHYAEYHRMEQGKAVETYLYLDMPDLLRQTGIWPLPESNGYEGFVPGPSTADGIVLSAQDPHASRTSLTLVEEMLKRLYTEDEGWRPYWHRNMYWYGPSGYGSYIGVDGFARFQLPYESIFDPDRVSSTYRVSGDARLDGQVRGHFARFADGHYVASGGWPSHGGFLVRPWLGVDAKDQMFTVRVADIWRRHENLLVENWVFVDLVDMLLQLDCDVFRKAGIEITLD